MSEDVRRSIRQQFGHLGKELPELFHHSVQLAVDLGGRQLLVDGADHARRSWVATPGWARLGTRVSRLAMKWGAAALPAGPSEHRGDGVLQPLVGIGGYQLHPAEASSGQRPQEGQPKEAGPENSPPLLPNGKRPAVIEPGEPPSPGLVFTPTDLRAGREGRVCLARGVCGLGGADTLNIGYSLWQDCPCIVPPRVRSDTSAADEGAASQHSVRTAGFQPFPP